jgi:DNA-binding CsgD family transcriptional regulator
MLLPGTEMHLITFLFVCLEIVILFYLLIYRLARPGDKSAYLNIILISLLIAYNIASGLLPDANMPGSIFVQICIAYATGFITPCYFPYYVHKAFGLKKMRFHAYRGVYLFLILPYILFISTFAVTNNLNTAKNLLILAVLYAVWVVYSLLKAIKYKYKNTLESNESKEETIILFLSIASWVGVPVIDYFNFGQAAEASITNFGFLLLFSLQVKRHIKKSRTEYQRLIDSEEQLSRWNEKLQGEVDKRTREIERLSADERILEACIKFQLTKREREITKLICGGSSYKQIADKLFIAERTVTKHVQNIFDKVKVSNKLELLNKLGIVPIN